MRASTYQVSLDPVLMSPTPPPSFPAVLAKDGHKVILQKIEDWNVVELMVNEEVVFYCNITDLEFGKSFSTAPKQHFTFSETCSISSWSGQLVRTRFKLGFVVVFFFWVLNSYSKPCALCYMNEHILNDTKCLMLLPRTLDTKEGQKEKWGFNLRFQMM